MACRNSLFPALEPMVLQVSVFVADQSQGACYLHSGLGIITFPDFVMEFFDPSIVDQYNYNPVEACPQTLQEDGRRVTSAA